MAKVQMSLKARALRYLSQREHSRLELGRKLASYAQEGEDVDALLDQLEAAKFLSQERFSESLVRRRGARYGNSRILMELQSHGIEGEALREVKGRLVVDEVPRALETLKRKFPSRPVDVEQRTKCVRFLQQRGFSGSSIQLALKSLEQGDD